MLDNELIDMVKQIQLVRSESNNVEIKAANKGCPKAVSYTHLTLPTTSRV